MRIPRLPLSRGAGPKGLRGYPAAAAHGFPYEGKLSPEATDEVDCVTYPKVPPPHPSRLSPCHLPLIGEGNGARRTQGSPSRGAGAEGD